MENKPLPSTPDVTSAQVAPTKKSNGFLYGLLALALVAVAGITFFMVHAVNQRTNTESNAYSHTSAMRAEPTPTMTMSQEAAVTPIPLTTKQDVQKALQQIDSADTSPFSSDLNANTADASQFSQ